ncbi:ribonuclease III [Sistotremastrum suecicum HHB10207 ss-3]|uniref:Large ribosomal subunit protein mL44 n=1 Tax=Sistotremastrum suecicum HHB10207 ss-3 TaxID=1314776 RepID=A0A166HUH4_9AGAM|nr:ribonuclease III [Sistotremastrum suecicum HHB10207 ss-3]
MSRPRRAVLNVVKSLKHPAQPQLDRPRLFPPPEARTETKTAKAPVEQPSSSRTASALAPDGVFSPTVWASLQLPSPPSLTAFAHRVGLANVLTTPEAVQQIFTHPSFVPYFARYYPEEKTLASNAALSNIGNALLGLFAAEHLHATYPHLPTRVLKAAVSAFVGPTTCANVARSIGAPALLRWRRSHATLKQPAVMLDDALASVSRSLVAVLYRERSISAARAFVNSMFLSRELDLRNLIKFRDPKMALRETVEKFGREPPKSRLLKETGRLSNSPIFVVGIYSGLDKLGEGFGSSLKMAEYRAAEDALHRLYLTRQPPHLLQVPSSTFLASGLDIFGLPEEAEYVPGAIGETEVLYGSAGKSGVRAVSYRSQVPSEVQSEEHDKDGRLLI